jgi:hypothetical protein
MKNGKMKNGTHFPFSILCFRMEHGILVQTHYFFNFPLLNEKWKMKNGTHIAFPIFHLRLDHVKWKMSSIFQFLFANVYINKMNYGTPVSMFHFVVAGAVPGVGGDIGRFMR